MTPSLPQASRTHQKRKFWPLNQWWIYVLYIVILLYIVIPVTTIAIVFPKSSNDKAVAAMIILAMTIPLLAVLILSFPRYLRNKKLQHLASEFGLKFTKQEGVSERVISISGILRNKELIIKDVLIHRPYYSIAGPASSAMRFTLLKFDGNEYILLSLFSSYYPVYKLRKLLKRLQKSNEILKRLTPYDGSHKSYNKFVLKSFAVAAIIAALVASIVYLLTY